MTKPHAARRWIGLCALLIAPACALTACSPWCVTGNGAKRAAAATGSLAFVAASPGSSDVNVFAAPPGGGPPRAITRGGPPVSEAAWSADGERLVFARRSRRIDSNGHATGDVEIFVLHRGGAPHLIRRCRLSCDARSFAWSPDGRRIAFVTNTRSRSVGFDGEIAVMDADGGGFHAVCGEAVCGQGLDDPHWSPDGSQLVFSNMGVIGFFGIGLLPSRVWMARPDGSGVHALTQPRCRPGDPPLRGCAYDAAASWSPAGGWIAFSRAQARWRRGRPPRTVVELMHADGSDLHAVSRCTGYLCNQLMPPVWSPDGSRLAYAPFTERRPRIVTVRLSGTRSTIRSCTKTRCVTPASLTWAPDGRSLALIGEARSPAAYVLGDAGRRVRRVARGVQCCLAWLAGSPRPGSGDAP